MFKNLKSLFIEEEENNSKKPDVTNTSGQTDKVKPPPIKRTTSLPLSPSSGKFNEKFGDILLGAMDKNNIEGFDYLEYRQSLQSLRKMDMDDPTRYKSAYAMAQTMGATPDYLIKTAAHYLDILKKEETKFGNALKHQRSRQIGEKKQQLTDLEKMIQQKAAQIQKLSKEIEEHQAQMKAMETELAQSSAKVETTENDFVASYNIIVEQIQADVENMRKYLK